MGWKRFNKVRYVHLHRNIHTVHIRLIVHCLANNASSSQTLQPLPEQKDVSETEIMIILELKSALTTSTAILSVLMLKRVEMRFQLPSKQKRSRTNLKVRPTGVAELKESVKELGNMNEKKGTHVVFTSAAERQALYEWVRLDFGK